MVNDKANTIGTVEAAKLLGMSRATFYTYAEEQGLRPVNPVNPRLKRQPRLLYRRSDVERLANVQQAS